eukprot:tig00021012_g17020.t1
MASPLPPASGSASGPAKSERAARLEEEFLRRLDRDIATLQESFMGIVRAAKIEEKDQVQRQKFEIDVRAQSMVFAGQSLSKLISELRESALKHDFARLNRQVDAQEARFAEQRELIESRMEELAQGVDSALHELEAHYNASRHRVEEDPLSGGTGSFGGFGSGAGAGQGQDRLEGAGGT